MAINENEADGSNEIQENLPAENNTETNQVNWEEKFKESEANWQKKWSEKDRSYNENAEKLKAFEKHSPTLEKISEILSQKKAEQESELIKNGDVSFLRSEFENKLQQALEQKLAPLEQQRAEAEQQLEVSNIQNNLTKTFSGQEKYGDFAKVILTETLNNEGEEAFWNLVRNPERVMKLAKGEWLDAQEKSTSEKVSTRQANAVSHRKAMAPTSRSGVSSDSKSTSQYKNMTVDELEKEWIKNGGTPLNLK